MCNNKDKIVKRYINILRIMAFMMLFLVVFIKAQKLLENKYSYEKYKPFFDEQLQFDVLFFGSSHILTAMSPMDLWNDYGITSYNFANSNERLATTYWIMQNAFDYHKPKMIVLDIGLFCSNIKYEEDKIDLLHDGFDCFPLSLTKIRAFDDILGNNKIKYEFLFNIGKYHSRWEELGEADFRTNPSWQKGIRSYTEEYMINVTPSQQNEIIYDKQALTDDMLNVRYLKKIIESCHKEGIKIVFVHNPYVANTDEQMAANSVADIAEEYDISYVNFVQIDTIIDMNTDMYNSGHVNASGMKKLTDYMGKYLTSHYDMVDHRQDPIYNKWVQDFNTFVYNKRDTLVNRPDLYSYLMLLHDNTYRCYIYIKEGSPIYEDEKAINLLQNIGKLHVFEDMETEVSSAGMRPLSDLENCVESKAHYLLIIDNSDSEIYENCDINFSANIGEARVNIYETDNPELYIGQDSINYFEDVDNQLYDLQIVVMDASTKEIVDISNWGGINNAYTERSN